ncbi:MAG: hypothetical protein A2073_07020, partial [Deltaproteobacteria bacterium GWC2_42_11]
MKTECREFRFDDKGMIKIMSKVQIIGSRGLLDEVIQALHNIGIVHIESMPARITFEDLYLSRVPVEKEKAMLRESLNRLIEKLKSIYLLLPPPEQDSGYGFEAGEGMVIADITSDAFLKEMDELEKEVRGLHVEKADLSEEISSIARYEMILKGIAPLVAKLKGLSNFETIGITIERAKEDIIPLLENEINRITETRYQFFVKDIDKDIIGIVITYPRQYDTRVEALISTEDISEIKLPHRYVDMTLFDALKVMIRRREEIPEMVLEIDSRLKELSRQWHAKLDNLMRFVRDTVDELKTLAYCGHTRFAFVIFGWIPKDDFPVLTGAVKKRFGDKVMVCEVGIREDEIDLIPVYIKNPGFLRPFEIFLNVLPPPKYSSIDPTPYLALFFPTFFGLILGDAGYGVILFAISLYLKKRFKGRDFITNLASIFLISSLFAVAFGILFGEMFGDLGERLGIIHPILFDRLKAMQVFLVLAIGIGVGHVAVGLMLAIVNYIHRGKGKHAMAKASMLILIFAMAAILAALAGYLPRELISPGMIVVLAAFAALILFEGIIGPLEAFKTIGNILSYARIMAIGTASVVLALVANKIGGMAGNVFLGILIAGIIHVMNILLGILVPTIHSLRLHYVEFFSKFYET